MFIFPLLRSLVVGTVCGFYDAPHSHRPIALCDGFSEKLLSTGGRIFTEMHFKPANQAAMTELCIGKTNRFRHDGIESRLSKMKGSTGRGDCKIGL